MSKNEATLSQAGHSDEEGRSLSLAPYADGLNQVVSGKYSREALAHTAAAIYLDTKIPVNSDELTLCKMGDPALCPENVKNLVFAVSELLRAVRDPQYAMQVELDEAIAGLRTIREFIGELDIIEYTNMVPGGNTFAYLYPDFVGRPDMPVVTLLRLTPEDRIGLKHKMYGALEEIISIASNDLNPGDPSGRLRSGLKALDGPKI